MAAGRCGQRRRAPPGRGGPPTYTVTVSQGAFDSYILHTDDSPNIYKVEMVH